MYKWYALLAMAEQCLLETEKPSPCLPHAAGIIHTHTQASSATAGLYLSYREKRLEAQSPLFHFTQSFQLQLILKNGNEHKVKAMRT